MLILFIIALITVSAVAENVSIPTPPVLLKISNATEIFYQVADRGEPIVPFELPCIAKGTPNPIYRWIKDGREIKRENLANRITQLPGTGTLIFNTPREDDGGVYQCIAENELGVAAAEAITVTKAFLGNFADTSMKMLYVIDGRPEKLECNPPVGVPKPEVIWLTQANNGSVIQINSTRITPDPDGNLWFSHVSEQDDSGTESTYVCSVTSSQINKYKIGGRVKLNVRKALNTTSLAPVLQYVSPSDMVALQGQNVELFCIFGGKPTPNIVWKKDGNSLHSSYRLNFGINGKSIQLREVGFNDTGNYSCQAVNGINPSQNYTINLKVQSKPTITSDETALRRMVAEGEDAYFECKAEGVPLPTIEWLYNSAPLRNSILNPRRILTETSLSIRQVEKSDVGTYTCVATNSHGTATQQGYLSVSAIPPTVTNDAANFTAFVGGVAEVYCPVFGVPTPQVEWLRYNEPIITPRFERNGSALLKIYNAELSDTGNYTCQAVNKFGRASATVSVEVKGVFRILHPPQDRTAPLGDWISMECFVESSRNDVEVEWLKDGIFINLETMPRVIRGIDGSISIFQLVLSDAGVYTCVAKSGLEERRASAKLTVTE